MIENEVIQAILGRRSIRSYRTELVPEEMVKTVLTAGQYAPSGSNSQSWRFTAIVNSAKIDALNVKLKACFAKITYPEDEYPAKLNTVRNSTNEKYHFCYHAPVLIIVSNVAGYTNAMADSAAAIENMLLAAHSLGLACCWINQLTWLAEVDEMREYLNREYGVPLNHKVCGSLAIGFTDKKLPKALPRKEGAAKIIS